MRRIFRSLAAVVMALGLSAGFATSASAVIEVGCLPVPIIKNSGGVVTASGRADCNGFNRVNVVVGVAIVAYSGGVNAGSTYYQCNVTGTRTCTGIPITKQSYAQNWCTRVIVDYKDPLSGSFVQKSASTGNSCPF